MEVGTLSSSGYDRLILTLPIADSGNVSRLKRNIRPAADILRRTPCPSPQCNSWVRLYKNLATMLKTILSSLSPKLNKLEVC